MEDVYITGFVAQKCGIKRQHNPYFTDQWKFLEVRNLLEQIKQFGNLALDKLILYHLDCGLWELKSKSHRSIRQD